MNRLSYLRKHNLYLSLVLALLFVLLMLASCKEDKEVSKTQIKFSPSTYKTIWNKKVGISPLADVLVSADGKRILVISQKEHLILLDSVGRKVWKVNLSGLNILQADLSKDGAGVVVSTEKIIKTEKGEVHQAKLFLLDDSGKTIWEKEAPAGYSGFFTARISSERDKIFAAFSPFEQDSSTLSFFAVYDSSGQELLKQVFPKGQIADADVSSDFNRQLVNIVLPTASQDEPPQSMAIGYQDGRETFNYKSQGGTISRFLKEDNFILANAEGKIGSYRWGNEKPLWKKKVAYISSLNTSEDGTRILAQALSSVSGNERDSFVSAFWLFSDAGKKLWQNEFKGSANYRPVGSSRFEIIAFVPSKATEPALLYDKLSAHVLPQKLPAKTVATSFSPDNTRLAICTSDGHVKLLSIDGK